MAISELVRRRMRQYAEAYIAKGDDHHLTELLLAAQKFARMAKIFTVTGCAACRERRIAGSETLTALAYGTDRDRIAQALADFHRVSEPEAMLDLVVRYASMVGDPVLAREAIAQLGRWMHLPHVRHRMASLAVVARTCEVRILAAQVLWAHDMEHAVDEAIRMTPTIARMLPKTKPTPETWRNWVLELPRVQVFVDQRKTLAELQSAVAGSAETTAAP